ncbi:MAG TPA: SPFH domain-containing protein [Pseudomonadota bacterium]|jgi:flotillin|nr:SPFH domain-containing protein [Pseudomonadota bacterium]
MATFPLSLVMLAGQMADEPPPRMISEDGQIAGAVMLAAVFSVGLLIFVWLLRQFLFICRPNELLVVSGKGHRTNTGETTTFTVVLSGAHFRIPFLQTVDRMDLRLIPIELSMPKALSAGGIPLDIHAIANVKISSDPRFVYNAVERFLGLPRETIWQTAKQTLEGSLRDVISQLTPEQVNQDRIEFANQLVQVSNQVFNKMGLQLDTLKIQRVEDEAGYLVNLGRAQIAAAVRDAENAENQANQEIAQEEAAARQLAEVAQKDAEIGVAQKRNLLRQIVGQLEGQAQAVEREAVAASEQARAEAEQELQMVRKDLNQRKLYAEVVLPAEADQNAQLLLAEGDASPRREQGLAAAEAMRVLTEALQAAGPQARELFVLSQLDTLVAQVASKVKDLSVREIQIVDSGDGTSLAQVAAAYPAIVTEVLSTLKGLTGVDIKNLLTPPTEGGRP